MYIANIFVSTFLLSIISANPLDKKPTTISKYNPHGSSSTSKSGQHGTTTSRANVYHSLHHTRSSEPRPTPDARCKSLERVIQYVKYIYKDQTNQVCSAYLGYPITSTTTMTSGADMTTTFTIPPPTVTVDVTATEIVTDNVTDTIATNTVNFTTTASTVVTTTVAMTTTIVGGSFAKRDLNTETHSTRTHTGTHSSKTHTGTHSSKTLTKTHSSKTHTETHSSHTHTKTHSSHTHTKTHSSETQTASLSVRGISPRERGHGNWSQIHRPWTRTHRSHTETHTPHTETHTETGTPSPYLTLLSLGCTCIVTPTTTTVTAEITSYGDTVTTGPFSTVTDTSSVIDSVTSFVTTDITATETSTIVVTTTTTAQVPQFTDYCGVAGGFSEDYTMALSNVGGVTEGGQTCQQTCQNDPSCASFFTGDTTLLGDSISTCLLSSDKVSVIITPLSGDHSFTYSDVSCP